MTTRPTMADGTTFDVDEETEATGITHFNGSAVVNREYTGPTPEKKAKPEDPAARKAELLAELDALEASTPAGAAAEQPADGELEQLRARVAELEGGGQ
jgi:hypothetical protein